MMIVVVVVVVIVMSTKFLATKFYVDDYQQ
jgi:hypothetical protein